MSKLMDCKKLWALLLSAAIAFAFMPTLGGFAFADDEGSEVTVVSAKYTPVNPERVLIENDKNIGRWVYENDGSKWFEYHGLDIDDVDCDLGDKLTIKFSDGNTKNMTFKEYSYMDDDFDSPQKVYTYNWVNDADPKDHGCGDLYFRYAVEQKKDTAYKAGNTYGVNLVVDGEYNEEKDEYDIKVLQSNALKARIVNPKSELAKATEAGKAAAYAPAKVSLTKVKKGKKKMTVKFKKTNFTTGYQIQYSTDKNFSKGNKMKSLKDSKYKKKGVVVKGLSKKTTYYVHVRAYRTANGKTYVGPWSVTKTVKTK